MNTGIKAKFWSIIPDPINNTIHCVTQWRVMYVPTKLVHSVGAWLENNPEMVIDTQVLSSIVLVNSAIEGIKKATEPKVQPRVQSGSQYKKVTWSEKTNTVYLPSQHADAFRTFLSHPVTKSELEEFISSMRDA